MRMKCSTYDSIPTNVIRVTIFNTVPFLKSLITSHPGRKKDCVEVKVNTYVCAIYLDVY